MPGVLVAEMVAQTRRDSGLRNNRLWSDDQICTELTSGFHEMRDKMVMAGFAGWFRAEHRFTLENGTDGNSVSLLDLDPQYQMTQGLDLLDSNDNPQTVPMLPSFAQRNNYTAAWPFVGGWNFSNQMGRNYMIDGDTLFVLPPQNAAGTYRHIYTPQAKPLAMPTTPAARSVSLNTGDVVAALGRWTFPAATFTTSDEGATFTVTGATNPTNNGAKVILSVVSSTVVITASTLLVNETFGVGDAASIQPTSTGSRTFEGAGADGYLPSGQQWVVATGVFTASDVGATITFASATESNEDYDGEYTIVAVVSATTVLASPPAGGPTTSSNLPLTGTFTVARNTPGTLMQLPEPLTPWMKYPVYYASRAILASRKQATNDLELQYQQIVQRVKSLTKQRSQDVRQAPRTGSGFGWGGGFGR